MHRVAELIAVTAACNGARSRGLRPLRGRCFGIFSYHCCPWRNGLPRAIAVEHLRHSNSC